MGPPRHPGHQSAARVGEVLAGAAVAVGGIAHGFNYRRAGADLALLTQLQGAPAVPGMAWQQVPRRDQLAVGVHRDGGLVTVAPVVAALVAVARLRIMYRQGAVLAHSHFQVHLTVIMITVRAALHVLPQQPAQPRLPPPLSPVHAPLSTGQSGVRLPGPCQQPVGVGPQSPQPGLPGPPRPPV